jgi:hypothetical protein
MNILLNIITPIELVDNGKMIYNVVMPCCFSMETKRPQSGCWVPVVSRPFHRNCGGPAIALASRMLQLKSPSSIKVLRVGSETKVSSSCSHQASLSRWHSAVFLLVN